MGTAINSFFNSISSGILYPIYYGLVGIIGIAALIWLIVEIVQAIMADEHNKSSHIKQAAVVFILVVVAAFAPMLINYAISLAGTGVITQVK